MRIYTSICTFNCRHELRLKWSDLHMWHRNYDRVSERVKIKICQFSREFIIIQMIGNVRVVHLHLFITSIHRIASICCNIVKIRHLYNIYVFWRQFIFVKKRCHLFDKDMFRARPSLKSNRRHGNRRITFFSVLLRPHRRRWKRSICHQGRSSPRRPFKRLLRGF